MDDTGLDHRLRPGGAANSPSPRSPARDAPRAWRQSFEGAMVENLATLDFDLGGAL